MCGLALGKGHLAVWRFGGGELLESFATTGLLEFKWRQDNEGYQVRNNNMHGHELLSACALRWAELGWVGGLGAQLQPPSRTSVCACGCSLGYGGERWWLAGTRGGAAARKPDCCCCLRAVLCRCSLAS